MCPRVLRAWLLAVVALVAMFVSGCSGCRRSEALAVLLKKAGTIERDSAGSVGAWKAAEPKAEFFVGDGVRSSKASGATLTLDDQSELALEESTLIRFLDKPPGSKQQHFDLEMGEAVLTTGAEPLTLETAVGLAVVDAQSRVTLRKSDGGMRYQVSVGMARFEGKGGQKVEVGAGQGIEIGIGTAQLERYEVAKAEAPAPPAPAPSASAPEPVPVTGEVSTSVKGGGATVRAPGETAFAKLATGAGTIAAGSTVRLSSATTAEVAQGNQRATLKGAGEFVIAEAGKSFIQAHAGGVSFTHVEGTVAVTVPGGSILAKVGSSADVRIQGDETKVAVSTGSVEIQGPAGTEEIRAGEEGTLGSKGGTEVAGRGPGYVDFVAGAGASFVVHDPKPPTAIGFATASECAEGAIVQLSGRGRTRSRGTGVVSVLVPPGGNKYEVFCVTANGVDEKAAAGGSVTVMRDSGTARIPRTAPATLVDTDGRTYTVLYQNLLPKISVRWPAAPKTGSYSLELSSPGGKSQTVSSATPQYAFASGALREGVHRLTFSAGGARSKTTSVDIRFDNATPTATLTSPADGGFGAGSTVTVAGVVLEGWKVSAGGAELPLDAQLRFSGTVTAPSGEHALAIQFVHPRRGLHYYLRRSAGH